MENEYISCNRVDISPGDYIDRKYRVDKLLGEGTYGQVYKVRANNVVYALKLLKLWEVLVSERAGLLKRFNREFDTGRIPSAYLVHSVGKGIWEGNPYILMEYCSGGDLMAATQKDAHLDIGAVAEDILYGLKDLHQCGKIHRDLKPENVLLKADGRAVLTDFGIAGDQNNRISRMDCKGNLLERFGTYAYMPPEQINPSRKNRTATVLPTSDIFSFGVMMYQVLTGEFPFGELNSNQDLCRYIDNVKKGKWNRELLNRIAPKWFPAIDGCLRPKFSERHQSVDKILPLIPDGVHRKQYQKPKYEISLNVVHGTLLRVMEGEEYGRVYKLDELGSKLDEMTSLQTRVITVGRKDDDVYNTLKIMETESSYVSRCHCTIEQDLRTEKWLIRDGQARVDCHIAKRSAVLFPCRICSAACLIHKRRLEWHRSLNGTYVNSKEVDSDGTYFTPGDIISIGGVKLRVEGY